MRMIEEEKARSFNFLYFFLTNKANMRKNTKKNFKPDKYPTDFEDSRFIVFFLFNFRFNNLLLIS